MTIKLLLAVIASILAIIGNISYLRDVFYRRVVPHPYTWLIWSIVSLVTFFGQVQKGAGIGALPTGIAEGFTIIIFLYSLRQLFDKKTKLPIRTTDHYFFALALLGLIPWILTNDPTLSVIIVVSIDLIAFIPTLQKTYHHPHTEQPTLYRMNVLRHILTLASLNTYNIATTIHSIAMIITNTLMNCFIRKAKTTA